MTFMPIWLQLYVLFTPLLVRQQRRGTSQRSRFWIQGSVRAPECKADSGQPWAPVAWRLTQCPISGSQWCSSYTPWCWHKGTTANCTVGGLWRSVLTHTQGFMSFWRWQIVYAWCPWINQRPYQLTHTCGRLLSVTINTLPTMDRRALRTNYTEISVSIHIHA